MAAWRRVLHADPEQVFTRGLAGFWPEYACAILGQFRAGMHARIGRRLPWYGRGRKWGEDWQRAARQDARRINTPGLLVRATEITTDDWLSRFAQRFGEEAAS